jgi:hypothetical protein
MIHGLYARTRRSPRLSSVGLSIRSLLLSHLGLFRDARRWCAPVDASVLWKDLSSASQWVMSNVMGCEVWGRPAPFSNGTN